MVRSILNRLLDASKLDTRLTHRAVPHNYQRLLKRIDSCVSPYSSQEYLSAVHNPSYRDVKNKMVVKHPSEWYHKKDTSIWQTFLNRLTSDAPEWREYCEANLDKMVWMQDASQLKLGPSLWHMHPVAFLGALLSKSEIIILEMLLASNLGQNKSQCETVLPYINKYAKSHGMSDCKEIAHFLSQIGHESGFSVTEENLNYSAKGMRRIFGCIKGPSQYSQFTDDCNLGRLRAKLWSNESTYAHHPKNLANYVYASRMGNDNELSGDGYKYRGRGMIQLTGKDGYKYFTMKHNEMSPDDPKDFVSSPGLVISEIEYGVESAFSFWLSKNLNIKAKKLTVHEVTDIVNGGQNGYDDRLARFNAVAPLPGVNKE